MVGNVIGHEETWMEMIKNFDYQGIIARIMGLNFNWVELGSCAGIGFLSGFLFKKYFKTFLLCLLFGGAIVLVLDYANMVHIDWAGIQSMFGAQPIQQEVSSLFQYCLEFIKLNVMAVSCFSAGFIVGLKVG